MGVPAIIKLHDERDNLAHSISRTSVTIKKRLIFTLLYNNGSFMLSRNFRLQRVGDIRWLQKNYNFSKIAASIDELIILDTTRSSVDTARFCEHVRQVTEGCFMPLAVGGGVRTLDQVRLIMHSGAEKVVMNTALYDDPEFVREVVRIYGSQCVVGSIDWRQQGDSFVVFIGCGSRAVPLSLAEMLEWAAEVGVGEIYLNSMDRDGTGQGYALDVLAAVGQSVRMPVIMAGGAGNYHHLLEGIRHSRVDAVATANLFNFIGDGLPQARAKLIDAGVPLAQWRM